MITTAGANGQTQERTLVDRLLKPDTTLQNSEQNKKSSQGTAARTQAATTKSFYVREKKLAQNFLIDRRVATTSYVASNFATTQLNPPGWRQSRNYSVHAAPSPSGRVSGSKNFATGQFASSRPFKGEGKSQKALNTQHRPLTIDEVRELLNKNK